MASIKALRDAHRPRRGENSSSSTSSSSTGLKACVIGEKKRCAMKVGTTADRITALIKSEN